MAIEPDKAEAWYNKGDALYARGRNEEALAAYDRALAIEPDNAGHTTRRLGLGPQRMKDGHTPSSKTL